MANRQMLVSHFFGFSLYAFRFMLFTLSFMLSALSSYGQIPIF